MSFATDKQTLDDLNILGKYKPNSIFNIFNQVRTAGGEKLLEQMFLHPLSNPDEINERSSIFSYFQNRSFTFPFSRDQFDVMEGYLSSNSDSNILFAGVNNLKKLFLASVIRDNQYEQIHQGITNTAAILETCYEFINGLADDTIDNPYSKQIQWAKDAFQDKRLQRIIRENVGGELSLLKLIQYDYLLRHTLQKVLQTLITFIYDLDVYIAVSSVASARGFIYATASPKSRHKLTLAELYHPALAKPVGNTLSLQQESNMVFLTGANMAGKSTLMKSFGIAVYLAHMGFPIAAKALAFSVKDGIYSSINVPDNLNKGYSHFYAEVLRVKAVAQEVSNGKDVVVIFDELFKGTNVKDAYDATLAVTKAFSTYGNCFFIISTHIIEVGQTLRESCANIQFSYLPTVMKGTIPHYPYKLEQGITTDRQGMIIIENEGILDILWATGKVKE